MFNTKLVIFKRKKFGCILIALIIRVLIPNNLFKSVSESILTGFQSWLEDPYKFAAAKREQQQINLLQQQVKLLSASGFLTLQRALPVIAKEDIATATSPGFLLAISNASRDRWSMLL